MSTPRYSREDFADQVQRLTMWAMSAEYPESFNLAGLPNLLRATAAMMSEAANRAPTHAELVAEIEAGRPRA